MFVACPHCGFLVAAHAGTSLRCPRCGSAIDPKLAKPRETAETTAAPAETTATAAADAAAMAVASEEGATKAAQPPAIAAEKQRRSHHAPSFVRRHAPAPIRTTHWRNWLILSGLTVLLLGQLMLAQRDELAANARWRPLITGMCTALRCEVPAWREPTAFTMLQRSVQPRPGSRGVLHVSASFRNDARWAQPWPTVMLTLSDMDGRQVGQRAFVPTDYLGKGDKPHIAPGQSVTLQLDVVEPAQQVVAFTFDFM